MAIRDDYSAFEDFGGLDYFTPEDAYQPEGSYYTYGAIPSAVPEEEPVYVPRGESVGISPLPGVSPMGPVQEYLGTPYMPEIPIAPQVDERVIVPRSETVGITPSPGVAPGPVQEFVGTPYMPQFDVTPVAPPLAQAEAPVYVPREDTVPVTPPLAAAEAPVYVPRETSEVVAPVTPISAPLSAPAPAPAPTAAEAPKTDIFAAMKAFGAAPSLLPPLAQAGTGGKDLTAGDLYKSERERLVSDYDKQVAALKAAGNFTPQNDEALKATLNYQLDKLVKDETNYLNTLPQRQALSELLKANKFSEAYQYAKDNGLQLLLTQPTELKNLRDPFTKEEARQFIRAMPQEFIKSAYGDQYKFDDAWTFDPEGAESRGALTWVAGMGPEGPIMSETGYPQLDRILQAKEVRNEPGVFQDIFKAAALAAAVFGGAQALGGLGGGGASALTGVTPTGLVPGTTAANLAAAKAAAAGASTLAGGALPTFTIATGGGLTAAQLAALGAAGAAGAGALGSGAGTTAPTTTTTTTTAPTQPAAPEPTPLQEIVVSATKPIDYTNILASTFAAPGVLSDILVNPVTGQVVEPVEATQPTPDQEVAQPEPSPLEEVVVTGTKPSLIEPLILGGLAAIPGAVSGAAPAAVEPPLEEVVVQGTKPQPDGLIDPLTAAQLIAAAPTTAEILKDYKPTEVKESGLDKLKSAISKYQDLQKLLKLIGALGAGASGGAKVPTTTPTTGGLGGALPKYELKRVQYAPAVDYYSYGTQPEAQFFGYEMKKAEDSPDYYAPPVMIVPPQDRPPVFQSGGLTGYAKGGDSSPQYVDGPGSGREDKIPALLSDGEYVIDAETLALLGDGSTKEGARRMDDFRAKIRKHKGRALSRGRISPDAKSPEKYMGGGLT